MGRPKEFDPADALQSAMDLFWRQGYKATSMQDLVTHMGINRGSLYDTFGSKEALFQQALDSYCERVVNELLESLAAPGSPQEVLSTVFQGVADHVSSDGARGCLLTNTTVELAPHCPTTAEKVLTSLRRIEDGFHTLLTRDGWQGRNDPRSLARFLVGSLQGLAVVAKANSGRATLDGVVDVILSTLD